MARRARRPREPGSRSTSRGWSPSSATPQGARARASDWPTALRGHPPPAPRPRAGGHRLRRAARHRSGSRSTSPRDAADAGGRGAARRRTATSTACSWTRCCAARTRRHARALRAARRAASTRSATATCDADRRADRLPGRQLLLPRACARRRATGRWESAFAGPPPLTAMGWEVSPTVSTAARARARDYGVPITSPRTARPSTTAPPATGPSTIPGAPRTCGATSRARPRARRRRRRAPLLRVVADGQLRVERRLRQALRHRARRLRDAAAYTETQRTWYRDHIARARNARRPTETLRPLRRQKVQVTLSLAKGSPKVAVLTIA